MRPAIVFWKYYHSSTKKDIVSVFTQSPAISDKMRNYISGGFGSPNPEVLICLKNKLVSITRCTKVEFIYNNSSTTGWAESKFVFEVKEIKPN